MDIDTILSFLSDNYIWFLLGGGVLLIALIGFIFGGKKKKKEEPIINVKPDVTLAQATNQEKNDLGTPSVNNDNITFENKPVENKPVENTVSAPSTDVGSSEPVMDFTAKPVSDTPVVETNPVQSVPSAPAVPATPVEPTIEAAPVVDIEPTIEAAPVVDIAPSVEASAVQSVPSAPAVPTTPVVPTVDAEPITNAVSSNTVVSQSAPVIQPGVQEIQTPVVNQAVPNNNDVINIPISEEVSSTNNSPLV